MAHADAPFALITGGAGFIGANLADRLLGAGRRVTVFDNLSRSGGSRNLAWLQATHGAERLHVVQADLRDFAALREAAVGAERVYHLAGQVAVTSSVRDPRSDFEDNALGTFNALEAARLSGSNPVFLYASTNKVYGGMDAEPIDESAERYAYAARPFGISEEQPLDFHSPYGCSKGAGDQYTRDYARIYGLRTVVFRQSCIYGYRQFGVEDQGWVAWFIIAALKGRPISIYGDGKQVRDVLFIDDLLEAYEAAMQRSETVAGEVFNVGGGPQRTMSVWCEFGRILEGLLGQPIAVTFADWRPGDQRVYVSDIRKAERLLGWRPRTSVEEGIGRLFHWVRGNLDLFQHL